jgi:hypothetical protein
MYPITGGDDVSLMEYHQVPCKRRRRRSERESTLGWLPFCRVFGISTRLRLVRASLDLTLRRGVGIVRERYRVSRTDWA